MTVPTALMRQGNFSELLNPSNPYYAGGKQLYVPGTCPVYGAATCVPYPGNVIPAAQLSPNGVGIMNSYPLPTPGFQQGSQNYAGSLPNPENQRKGQINGDFSLRRTTTSCFGAPDNSFYQLSPYNQSNPQVPIIFERPNQTISAGWVWTISPTMINEAHTSVSVDDVYIQASPGGAGYDRGAFGIDFAYIVPGSKASEQKIPTATLLPTFSSIAGGPYPSHSSGIIYTAPTALPRYGQTTQSRGAFLRSYGRKR